MIKPMVVDLEVDAILGDGFYYYCFFYSQQELGFTKSYLHFFFFEKSYTPVSNLRTLAYFQGGEMSPDGIRA